MTTPLPDWMNAFGKPDIPPKYTPIITMTRDELVESQKKILRAGQPFYNPPPPKPKLPACPTDFAGLLDVLLGGSNE